jgi:hypothetical protein
MHHIINEERSSVFVSGLKLRKNELRKRQFGRSLELWRGIEIASPQTKNIVGEKSIGY